MYFRPTTGMATEKQVLNMKYQIGEEKEIETLLQPETPLEARILQQEDFRQGLMWGEPRYGHPEGKVVLHVREVLDNVDQLPIDADTRRQLRLVALIHDTFKHLEKKGFPRDWSQHHSILALQFAQQFISDQLVLDTIELHDEAYYVWRGIHLYHQPANAQHRLNNLLSRMKGNMQFYYLFFKSDTCTGDKTLAPLKWFEATMPGIKYFPLRGI